MDEPCSHFTNVSPVDPTSDGCIDCLAIGGTWVHLRACVACGHVGCCDQSPNRHATKHFRQTDHPLIRSYEPGEAWWYCYKDDAFFEPDGYGALKS